MLDVKIENSFMIPKGTKEIVPIREIELIDGVVLFYSDEPVSRSFARNQLETVSHVHRRLTKKKQTK